MEDSLAWYKFFPRAIIFTNPALAHSLHRQLGGQNG